MKKKLFIILLAISSLSFAKEGGFIATGFSYNFTSLTSDNFEHNSNLIGIDLSYNFFAENNYGFGAKLNYSHAINQSINKAYINDNNININKFDSFSFLDISLGISFKQNLNNIVLIESVLPSLCFQTGTTTDYIDSTDLKSFYVSGGSNISVDGLYFLNSHLYIGLNITLGLHLGTNLLYIDYKDPTLKNKYTEKITNIFSWDFIPCIKIGYYF